VRESPIYLPVGPITSWELRVDLERDPQQLPDPVQITTRFGYLSLQVKELEKGYVVEGEFTLHPTLIPPAEYGELRDFLISVERHLRRPLELP